MNHAIRIKVANYRPFMAKVAVKDDMVMMGDSLYRGAADIIDVPEQFGFTPSMAEMICYCINEGSEFAGGYDGSEFHHLSFEWRLLDVELFKQDLRG